MQIYILPVPWSLEGDGEVTMRSKTESRALSHGVLEVGDYKADYRTLNLNFYFRADTREEYDEKYDEILEVVTKRDYNLYAGREDRFFRISRLDKIKSKWVNAYKGKFAEITATLRCADPFKYDIRRLQLTTDAATGSTKEPKLISVANPGSADAPLVIKFTPARTLPRISLTNNTTGEAFVAQDTLLINPATTVINGEDSTVYRGTANSINTFTGIFPRIDPGVNEFTYIGNAADIEMSFRPRWY